ncbi:hypothetical protein DAI22_06g038950 [Oryza sativa Japonica Group]|nr:hypothetical protein DAI22_06g038950 [Oryza sativa Japonica Group]KAF2925265.1 hypothetical protein DAI22_06g038950 [Oryza sativa Japonica Group]
MGSNVQVMICQWGVQFILRRGSPDCRSILTHEGSFSNTTSLFQCYCFVLKIVHGQHESG